MKKKWWLLALASVAALALVACGKSSDKGSQGEGDSTSIESSEDVGNSESSGNTDTSCVHKGMRKINAIEPTCAYSGNLECWVCNDCKTYFLDEEGTQATTREEIKLPQRSHDSIFVEALAASCDKEGNHEYYTCSMCEKYFEDEACTVVLEKTDVFLPALPHNLTHVPMVYGKGYEQGCLEHWYCDACEGYYADENADTEIDSTETVLAAPYDITDFIVEVPEDKTPVVLQLSDTQIIDAGQTRPGRDGVLYDWWATGKTEERCYKYVRETINATKPDFIIITGDVIYGEFDDNGSVWTDFIAFMESFQIPWSPVFGNHDNESKMGVDWQCQQLEEAEYCFFEQKTLSGNGNYSVGIAQGGVITRAFYLMDTHACGHASEESLANGHTYKDFAGFKPDQIDWYTTQIQELKLSCPNTKISFAYHIQQSVFGDAYAKYGFNQANSKQNINIDWLDNKAEGDFGYIGKQMKGPWDTDKAVYKGMKALGVDSIFVGHEHCNSASVVYEGIRFQYGQKSSEYDRFNSIAEDGTIIEGWTTPEGAVSMIGGTVIPLSEDGTIIEPYIYLCGDEADKRNQKPAPEPEVNGLQKGADLTPDGVVTIQAVAFDETTNAYAVTANSQGKLYINTALLTGKTSFTFSVYVASGYNCLAGCGPFSIRVKPDDHRVDNIPGGVTDGENKQYINFEEGESASADEVRLQTNTWQTFTVDITDITSAATPCTEFSFIIAAGNTIYLKDLALS
ncbi:MAG: metallophosphoesterase [Clostridia bacterium]|nr:metallophosphoesterase [Clostridia bacterium]